MIERRPRAPVLRAIALVATECSASSVKVSFTPSMSNSRRYCLTSAFFGFVRISISAPSSRSSSVATTGRRPMNSGIRPNFSRSSGSTSRRMSPVRRSSGRADLRAEAHPTLAAGGDDPLEAGEGAAADEQDVGGVDLQELLLRVLAAALRRHRGDGALHDLQQRLLHALARDVAGDRRIVGLAADLVDLVDVDDAALRALDIVVGRLQQLQDDVLDVLADIAGLGQRRGVRHGERHVEHAGQGLGQQRLAAAGRADQQDVRLGDLDVVVLLRRAPAACSGCAPPPRAPAWRGPGRSRSRRAPCRSRCGVGTPSRDFTRCVLFSSRMISMQSSTHSSQMNTVGPAMSLRTSCWLFPQNEQ